MKFEKETVCILAYIADYPKLATLSGVVAAQSVCSGPLQADLATLSGIVTVQRLVRSFCGCIESLDLLHTYIQDFSFSGGGRSR